MKQITILEIDKATYKVSRQDTKLFSVDTHFCKTKKEVIQLLDEWL